jgi:hypothetical protein
MTANLDRDFPVKPFQKVEQLVPGEAAEMPVHEVRHVGLGNAQDIGDFALFQLLISKDFEDVESDLRARQDASGTLLELNWFWSFSYSCANSCASVYRFLIRSTVSARQEVHDPADQYGDANKESKGLGTVQQPVAGRILGDYSEDHGDQEGKEHESIEMWHSHLFKDER